MHMCVCACGVFVVADTIIFKDHFFPPNILAKIKILETYIRDVRCEMQCRRSSWGTDVTHQSLFIGLEGNWCMYCRGSCRKSGKFIGRD